MERLFTTHKIRESKEIQGLWNFKIMDGNPEESRKVLVPSCWETYPGYEDYRGKAVYSKDVYAKGNVRLIFKGVSHTADVYFDGELVAHHYNAYTAFSAVIPNVEEGIHQIKVIVDNSYNEESSLHVINDYFTYGGINRPVILEEVDDSFIEYIHVTPSREDGKWYAEFTVAINHLSSGGRKLDLKLELDGKVYELNNISLKKGINKFSEKFFIPEVETYELDNPKLYYIHGKLYDNQEIIDDLIERTGFRTVEIQGKDILFNGKPLKIKGFNRHEDHELFGSAIPIEVMNNDIDLMVDMGANSVRTSHYPNDDRFLDLCDERGILVWEEGHARGLNEEQMKHKNFRKQSLNCIEEMIINHYNHPSIYIWGILNECASYSEYGRICYKEQFDLIEELDKSRPRTFASCHYKSDICLDLPEVVSMNIYPLWYHDSPAEEYVNQVYDWVQETEGKGKPYIVSEIGAGGIYGYRNNQNSKWTEDRQRDIIKQQLEAVESNTDIMGIYIWQFADCRVADETFYGRPRSHNNKGIVDEFRRKKLAYDIVKESFSKNK